MILSVFYFLFFFFFNDTATTEIYTLSLHDALPIHGTSGCCTTYCWIVCWYAGRPCAGARSQRPRSRPPCTGWTCASTKPGSGRPPCRSTTSVAAVVSPAVLSAAVLFAAVLFAAVLSPADLSSATETIRPERTPTVRPGRYETPSKTGPLTNIVSTRRTCPVLIPHQMLVQAADIDRLSGPSKRNHLPTRIFPGTMAATGHPARQEPLCRPRRPTRTSSSRRGTTCGCTSPGCRATPPARFRSSSAVTASTSTTPAASGTWTVSPGSSSTSSATAGQSL